MVNISVPRLVLTIASDKARQVIYRIRHAVYATELNQHAINSEDLLTDQLDLENHYILASYGNEVVGFISITSPASRTYSVDKYFTRSQIPFLFDEHLYEVRLLTVLKEHRNRYVAFALMFAAFRWIQSHGGKNIVAICRADLVDMYRKAGLRPLGAQRIAGKVTYELSVAVIGDMQKMVQKDITLYEQLKTKIEWKLPFSFFAPSACYHGGAFFKAIGEDLQTLHKAREVINADVLDAWFAPSPKVLQIIGDNLSWLLQTSPPTNAEGLVKAIATARGLNEQNILPGAGSSDLIFLSLRSLLNPGSRVLIIDPCYGEYIHVLENVIQCKVTRFKLSRDEGFVVNPVLLLQEIRKGYDMVILVNPNSPTGVHIPKQEMELMLREIPVGTLVWIDETYIEFKSAIDSLEQWAGKSENIIICKSMSKVYALSGVRAAYLCCPRYLIETLRNITPPWAISLPAQAAAIAALNDPGYYAGQYAHTAVLRTRLKQDLHGLGITEVIEGVANFLLFYLPIHFMPVNKFLASCRKEKLYLRDVSNMGETLGKNAIRIAVKDEQTNKRMLEIIQKVITTPND